MNVRFYIDADSGEPHIERHGVTAKKVYDVLTRPLEDRPSQDGVRGVTAARYADGSNVVVVDPDVLDVFPDAQSVNDALRALAEVIRRGRGRRSA